MEDLNPQRDHMADESMVRNLAAQAEAIWPQEAPLFGRYPLPEAPEILDAGCGTGEITVRLAELFPRARIVGVDVLDEHLARARRRAAPYGARVRFENQSVFELGYPDGAFDLVVCRHLLQAIPQTERVLRELLRVARPGGTLHLISEDYGMMHFEPRRLDPDDFWNRGPVRYGEETGTDLRVGRRTYGHLRRLGARDITVDYIVVDPVRVPRDDVRGDLGGLARRLCRLGGRVPESPGGADRGPLRRHDRHAARSRRLRRLVRAGGRGPRPISVADGGNRRLDRPV